MFTLVLLVIWTTGLPIGGLSGTIDGSYSIVGIWQAGKKGIETSLSDALLFKLQIQPTWHEGPASKTDD